LETLANDPNGHIDSVLRHCEELLSLSEQGEAAALDDGCRLLYGIVRDCAHRMRASAERERDAHKRPRIWERTPCPEA
jgi:hypothetical protein